MATNQDHFESNEPCWTAFYVDNGQAHFLGAGTSVSDACGHISRAIYDGTFFADETYAYVTTPAGKLIEVDTAELEGELEDEDEDEENGDKKFLLHKTSIACPEQYDVYLDGKEVGYLRLRHGSFTVDSTSREGYKNLERYHPYGDGEFTDDERAIFLGRAMEVLAADLGVENRAYEFLELKHASDSEPRYEHDYEGCEFLGQFGRYDVYLHPDAKPGETYLCRYGDEPNEYASYPTADWVDRFMEHNTGESMSLRAAALFYEHQRFGKL